MDARSAKAFDAAQDTIKLLITIASAIVGAVVTFSGRNDTLFTDLDGAGWKVPVSMLLLVVSIGSGLAALLTIVGALGNREISTPSPYQFNIRLFSGVQIVTFFLGMLILVLVPAWHW